MARVLVVEDDAEQLQLRRLTLGTAGHEVAVAQSAPEAIQLLAHSRFDVLVTDLRIPEVEDCIEVLRKAGETGRIVLSGWPDELLDGPHAALADRVFMKPVRTAVLLEAIRDLAAGRRRRES